MIVPTSLYGRRCSVTYAKTPDSFPPQKIHEVLPVGTILTFLSFFATLQDAHWFKQQLFKIVYNSGLRNFFPGRGGPKKYYIVEDEKGQKLVLPPVIFAIMKGPAGLGQREEALQLVLKG